MGDDGWNTCKVLESFLALSAGIHTATIFKEGLEEDADFCEALLTYGDEIAMHMDLKESYPRVLGPLVWYLAPQTRALRSTIAKIRDKLIPLIQARIVDKRASLKGIENTILDIIIDQCFRKGHLNPSRVLSTDNQTARLIADETMFLHLEAFFPIAMLAADQIMRVMAHPEYAEPLRAELTAAFALTGGDWSSEIWKHTPKLESFTRECLRLDTPNLFTGTRNVGNQPLNLASIGLTLNPGARVSLPSRDHHHDPEIYKDPESFDGYRFYDKVSRTTDPHGSTTISDSWIIFGLGRSVCPARVMALRMAQIMFSKVLLAYDIKPEAGDRCEYPSQTLMGVDAVPNTEFKMRVRPRALMATD
ncbi:cytochrome P450 [Penicillium macrosclerotiorum]|uniref:cytochrome P450 n=1 Tax=Penicillium macrosclerotiorum TaxID=303699 RepID=UPI0025491402|nr:cytochrome P450 [Penicillium macrosclerotiorum]KAJ5691745.1 cytochrome P450 [Penicillium macrosclerotiorum]